MGLPKAKKAAPKAAKSMTKTGIAKALATSCELKQKVCTKAINALAGIATKEVAKTGVFSLPGLCRLKTRTKPATKAGKREIFGKKRCQGKAREEGGEGLPGQGHQGQHLKRGGDACLQPSRSSVEMPRDRLVSRQEPRGSRACWVLVTQRLYMPA